MKLNYRNCTSSRIQEFSTVMVCAPVQEFSLILVHVQVQEFQQICQICCHTTPSTAKVGKLAIDQNTQNYEINHLLQYSLDCPWIAGTVQLLCIIMSYFEQSSFL